MNETTKRPATDFMIRGLGVAIVGVALTTYRETLPLVVTDLLLPIAFGLGTLLILRNLAAVCLGAGLLALVHSEPNGGHWIVSIAYPLIAFGCFATAIGIYGTRFRQHVKDSHDARWRSRR